MPLPAAIGHYRVSSLLGEGGMGAVYRATDTKLGRDVAIKVLPEVFAADPDRLARFTREAQVVASLNHPNIGSIYGVEERALILELIEGPTLADRIAQGPMPLDEALPLIRQLIDAIDYAHQKGVIHRDLKPANIKVTPEGKLKVLDFGLAKALSGQRQPSGPDLVNSPTMTFAANAGTVAGVILGTAAYMAPEQARGKAVDKRADIWAFGVVVYELLAGRRLFEGESTGDTLAQTLTKEIDLAPIPTPARALLRRCLDRDPHTRLRDLGDAPELLLSAGQPAAQPAASPRRPIFWVAAALAAFLAAAVFAVLWQRAATRREPPFVVRMGLGAARLGSPISPDGSTLLLTDGDGLQLRRLDELRARALPGTEGATWAFWSGDSAAIGFFQQGKLCVMPVATLEVRSVAPAPDPAGGAWRGAARTGDIVFVSAGKVLHLHLASGELGAVPVILPQGDRPLNPTFLPRGDGFVFTSGPADRATRTLYRSSLKGGAPVRLMETPYRVQFARHPHTGTWYMFYAPPEAPRLMAVPIDPATGQKSGEPVQLLDGVGASTSQRRVVETSDNGRLVFRRNFAAAPVFRIRWHAPGGRVMASLGDKLASNEILLSPDESQVAAITGYPRKSVWIFDARSGNGRRLTASSDNVGQGLSWSPDGRALYYQVQQPDETWNIVRHAADGATRPELTGRTDFELTLMDISPDGQYLVFGPSQKAGSAYFRLRTTPAAQPGQLPKPELWLSSGPSFRPRAGQARFTPDGRWLFAIGASSEGYFIPWRPDQTGEPGVFNAVTFPLIAPFFSPDGRQVCGVDRERGTIVCHSVTAVPGRPPVLGPAAVLFSATPQLSGYGKIGAIAKDGRILLLSTDEPEEVGNQFLSDWTALLPRSQPETP